MGKSSFGKTFSQGVGWFYLLRVFSRLISSIQIIIVARLLEPQAFGLLGIASLVLSLLTVLSATGNAQAIIQKKTDITEYLDTVWGVEVLRGFVLSSLIFLAAPLIAVFFKEPASLSILRVMAIVPFITGLSSPGLAKLNKELRFGKLALFQAIQSFLNAAFTILIAYLLRSVWALVIATLFGEVVRSLGSFFVHPYRPGGNFDFKKARELWGFGRWVLANQILHYLFNDGDDWVVGRVLSSQALGFYQMAYNIGNAPSTEVTSVFSQVAFPVFSRIQDDLVRLRLAYLRVMQVVMFLSTPVSVGIWLVAPDAVFFLMGEKWMPMVASLQILLIWGWIRSFRATIGPILLARGHPNHVALFTLVKVIVLALLILPFTLRWGIEGTSWAVVFSATIEIPLLFHSLRKDIQISYLELMQAIARPMWPALPMFVLVIVCQKVWLVNADILPRLIISILMGGLVYLASFVWLDHLLGWDVRADVQQAILSNLQPFLNLFKPAKKTQLP